MKFRTKNAMKLYYTFENQDFPLGKLWGDFVESEYGFDGVMDDGVFISLQEGD